MNSIGAFPPVYPILDAGFLPRARDHAVILRQLVQGLANAGVRILQYRNKSGNEAEIRADARVIRDAASGVPLLLIMNDWPELAVQVGFDGVHVGQTDMSAGEARAIVGPGRMVGVSTHNEVQLRAADLQPLDYIAIGPVFATATKENPDPVIGLDGVRLARSITPKPVVAIGGITAENARLAWQAGADSVAVISAVFANGRDPEKSFRDFMRVFQQSSQQLPGV